MTSSVADRFHIEGSRHPSPAAARVIYADGAGAISFRRGVDIELSHWVPNQTADCFKADTSTESCLRYAASPSRTDVDLVVNDHADVDGILSLYALLHAETALTNRDVLVGAGSMGDFHAWADRPAFRLAQELSSMLFGKDARPADIGDCYAKAFEITTSVLDGSLPEADAVASGWAIIEQGCERLARNEVRVEEITERLVSFVYPAAAAKNLDAALKIPVLNEIVDDSVWLWPQVRNHQHGEQVQIVSVPFGDDWFHDVWAPSYCWAETPDRWPLPGLVSTGDSNRWNLDDEALSHAAAELNATETSRGRWALADHLTPFETLSGRLFPVVLSFLGDKDQPAPSSLRPEQVAATLAPVW